MKYQIKRLLRLYNELDKQEKGYCLDDSCFYWNYNTKYLL